ncbi:MAG TPA: DUF503 domain-containing protein [Anaerolineaceae bacterium]|nr:DUF503 domain-containing protein [Anaerolineaceae bacterium]
MTRGSNTIKENHTCITHLAIRLSFPGCSSLKEKRSRLQPILTRLRREFNTGIAETGLQDVWQSAWISCVVVSNSTQQNARVTAEMIKYIETHYPDETIEIQQIEQR